MDFNQVFQQLIALYRKLNNRQRMVLIGTVFAVVAFVAFLVIYNQQQKASEDGYKVLFDNVDPKDAALIVQQLQQDGVEYLLPNDTTVLVPEEKVYEERIKLASVGLPKTSNGVGFELFDNQEFGATDFDQKVKFMRALEGELSRTIESLQPIEKAAVHVALPKESVFVSKDTPPTASVVLTLRQSMVLTPKQIFGIKNLVAAAVTKLLPDDVKIVDQNGNPLGEDDELTASKELAAAQMKYKLNYERKMEEKIIKIVSPIVAGPDHVVAKVSAEFDFAQKQSTQEVFDPNNVVRSEQNLEEKRKGYRPKEIGGVPGAVSNIGPVQGLEEQNVRDEYEKNQNTINYEVSKTVSSIKGEFAVIKRMSAAVVVDGLYEPNEEGTNYNWVALNQQQLDAISDLIKQTVGFNTERGDQVTVSNFEFRPGKKIRTQTFTEKIVEQLRAFLGPIWPLLKYILAGVILFIFYKKVILPFTERMLEVPTEEEEELDSLFEVDEDEDEDTLNKFQDMKRKVEEQLGIAGDVSEDEVKYEVLLEKIKELIEEKPGEIATLFQTLVRDELGMEGPTPSFEQASKD